MIQVSYHLDLVVLLLLLHCQWILLCFVLAVVFIHGCSGPSLAAC